MHNFRITDFRIIFFRRNCLLECKCYINVIVRFDPVSVVCKVDVIQFKFRFIRNRIRTRSNRSYCRIICIGSRRKIIRVKLCPFRNLCTFMCFRSYQHAAVFVFKTRLIDRFFNRFFNCIPGIVKHNIYCCILCSKCIIK